MRGLSRMHGSFMGVTLVLLSTTSSIKAGENKSIPVQDACHSLRESPVLTAVLSMTNQAEGFLKPRPDICSVLSVFKSFSPDDIVLTTTRTGNRFSVCIMNDTHSACTHIIADVESGIVPSDALSFSYGSALAGVGPQRQTVERLFIRPSKLIR